MSDPSQGERELVDLVRNGDTAAFASLYRANVAAVTRVVRTNFYDRDAVADVVQEVFVRALERLSTLREPDRFRPWLLAIARHAAIDQRRAQKHPHAAAARADDEPADLPASEPLPDEVAELHELAHLVDSCVANLSTRDATAISLVTHFGFTPADLACALGISVGAARVLTHRARQRLRDGLALELMVRRNRGCDEFKALIDDNQLLAGARHVRACDLCTTVVREEISLFSAQPLHRQAAPAQ